MTPTEQVEAVRARLAGVTRETARLGMRVRDRRERHLGLGEVIFFDDTEIVVRWPDTTGHYDWVVAPRLLQASSDHG